MSILARTMMSALFFSSIAMSAEESRFGQYDRDEDGRLNRVEVAGVRHLAVNFSRLDVDGNGYLSREEARGSNPHSRNAFAFDE